MCDLSQENSSEISLMTSFAFSVKISCVHQLLWHAVTDHWCKQPQLSCRTTHKSKFDWEVSKGGHADHHLL